MRKTLIAIGLALPALAFADTNLLTNGSFESFDPNTRAPTGWTLAPGNLSTNGVVIDYNSATPYPTGAFGEAVPADNAIGNPGLDAVGSHAFYFVDDFANPAETLTQQVSVTSGTIYNFGFDAYLPQNGLNNAGNAAFSATVGGDTFANFTVTAGQTPGWVHYSASAVANATASTDFTFSFMTNLFPSKDVVIDRVYFAAAVPEPGTYALMLAGLGAIGFIARRRKS
jgi:hypothetical protein